MLAAIRVSSSKIWQKFIKSFKKLAGFKKTHTSIALRKEYKFSLIFSLFTAILMLQLTTLYHRKKKAIVMEGLTPLKLQSNYWYQLQFQSWVVSNFTPSFEIYFLVNKIFVGVRSPDQTIELKGLLSKIGVGALLYTNIFKTIQMNCWLRNFAPNFESKVDIDIRNWIFACQRLLCVSSFLQSIFPKSTFHYSL